MRIRKRHLVLAAVIAGLVWLAIGRGDDVDGDVVTGHDAATSSARHSVADFVASLPTPASIKLRPMYVEIGELRLEGQAIDDAEHPIGGATITLNGARTTVTEADGSFAFDALAPAEYRVTAEKGPLYAEDSVIVYDGADPVSLEMKPGTTVVVHVLGEGTGPIREANVECDNHRGVTDHTGTVTFRGVDLSSANVEIVATGFGSLRANVITGDNPMAIIDKTFTLKSGAPVGGLVVDQDGKPVAEATVSIQATAGSWRDSIETDATGHWKVDGIGAGRLTASASSKIHIEAPDLVVSHDGVHAKLDVVIHVKLGLQITGFVVDEADKPIVEAHVSATGGYATTDDHGHFEIKGLAPGPIEISATTETKGSEIRKLELVAGSRPDVRIVVVDSSIAGVVKDGQGEPVADVAVWAHEIHDHGSGYGRTDELGKFDLGGLAPGDYELIATRKRDHQDMPKHGVIARSGNRRVSLVVPNTGTIVGRIMLDGAPVDYFGVVISDDPDGTSYQTPTTVRAPEGTFTETDLRPGSLALVIVGPNFMKKVIKQVSIIEGKTTDLGDIVVDRGRSVAGRVTDDRGQPVAGALVAISSGRSIEDETTLRPLVGDTRTAKADANGNYRVDGIPPDATDLNIGASAEHGIATPRVLEPTATMIDLVIAHTGAIDGLVTEAKGRSSVFARSTDGLTFYGRIESSGDFHLDRLPAGTYLVELHGHITIAPQVVTVTAGATTRVTFEVPAMLVTLGLHFAGCKHMTLESTPPAGTESIWLDSGECTNDVAELESVAPGHYRACADYANCSDIIVATAPQRQDVTIVPPAPEPEPEPDPDPITAPEPTGE